MSRGARRGVAAGVVLVVVLVAGWLWTALRPGLVQGSLSWHGTDLVELTGNDTLVDTETQEIVATDVDRATAAFSVRDDGRFAVVVEPAEDTAVPMTVEFLAIDADPAADAGASSLRLAPGQEAWLRVTVGWRECATYSGGSSTSENLVDLRVRSLGLTTAVHVPLEPSVRLTTSADRGPAAGCDWPTD